MKRLILGWGIAVIAAAAFQDGVAGQNAAPASAFAQASADRREVTFAKDVAPILYKNCTYCHRPGEVAPFSLMSYKDARPWGRAIKNAVTKRAMPPWNADRENRRSADPRSREASLASSRRS